MVDYGSNFARNVFEAWYRKHARVGYYLLTHSTVSASTAENWIRRNSPNWGKFKNLAERIEKYLTFVEETSKNPRTGQHLYSTIEIFLSELVRSAPIDHFTCFGLTCTLKESRLEARAERVEPKATDKELPGQLHFSFMEVEDHGNAPGVQAGS